MSKIVLIEMNRQCYNSVDNKFIEVLQGNVRKAIHEAKDDIAVITTMPGIVENIKIFEN